MRVLIIYRKSNIEAPGSHEADNGMKPLIAKLAILSNCLNERQENVYSWIP